jgi:flagellar export protein FliJ
VNRERLAAVLRVREIQERGARGELARSNRRLRATEEAERRTWADLDAALAANTGAITADRIRSLDAFVAGARFAAERQHGDVVVAIDEVDRSTAAWSIAAQRVAALERLAERLDTNDAIDAARTAANELDDAVLARRRPADRSTPSTPQPPVPDDLDAPSGATR